jgi:ATP-dependent Clp protease ATP-binding subunit ClpA
VFERFTSEARAAVVRTQDEARRLGQDRIGTEHLLLGVLGGADTVGARALAELGIDAERVREEAANATPATAPTRGDEEALRTIGIDLDEVRRAAEETFGPGALDRGTPGRAGHIPFRPEAKKALELALREALRLGHKHIGTEHVLLGIVRDPDGAAAALLRGLGITADRVREAVLRQIASGGDRPGRTA